MILRLLLFLSLPLLMQAATDPGAYSEDENINFTIKRGKHDTYQLLSQVTVRRIYLSERGLEFERMFIYEPHYARVGKIKLRVNDNPIRGDYKFSVNRSSDDIFLTDDLINVLVLQKTPKINDIVEYSYEQSFSELALMPLLDVRDIDGPVSSRIAIKHPEELTIQPEVFFALDSIHYTVTRPSSTETIINFSKFRRTASLPCYPFNDYHVWVLFRITHQDGRELVPVTPEAFAEWYTTRLSLVPRLDKPSAFPLLDSLRPVSDSRAKLRVIHDWIRKNIRYVVDDRGSLGILPHDPDTVLAKRFGDCKDRAYLACALAAELGLDVNLGVVSYDHTPPLQHIHARQYDHVICVYQDSGRTLFFDPTAPFHPFEDPPDAILGHPALILDPDQPRVEQVVTADTLPSLEIALDAHLDSLSTGRARIILRRDYFASMQNMRNQQSYLSEQQRLEQIVALRLQQIGLKQFEYLREGSRDIVFTATADLSRFLLTTPGRMYLPKVIFNAVQSDMLDRANDTLPLYFDSLAFFTAAVTLRGSSPLAVGADSLVLASGSNGSSTARLAAQEDGSLQCTYRFQRTAKFLQGSAKQSYIEFCKQYLAARKTPFTIQGAGG